MTPDNSENLKNKLIPTNMCLRPHSVYFYTHLCEEPDAYKTHINNLAGFQNKVWAVFFYKLLVLSY